MQSNIDRCRQIKTAAGRMIGGYYFGMPVAKKWKENLHSSVGLHKTVKPTYGYDHRSVFALCRGEHCSSGGTGFEFSVNQCELDAFHCTDGRWPPLHILSSTIRQIQVCCTGAYGAHLPLHRGGFGTVHQIDKLEFGSVLQLQYSRHLSELFI